MDRKTFLVQGSADAPYEVTFVKNDHNLSAHCTCPAGKNGLFCKHRMNIMHGVADGVVSPNKNDVVLIKTWLSGTDVEAALKEVMDKEELLDKAKQALSFAKKRLTKVMRE
jgi:uncharacterized Zn finger protein